MGVKGLYKFLSKYNILETHQLSDYDGMAISIDASIQMYKFKIALVNSKSYNGLVRSDGKVTSHIVGILNKTLLLLKNGIVPVWVFDGRPPDIKNTTLDNRKKVKREAEKELIDNKDIMTDKTKLKLVKQTVRISNDNITDIKQMLEYIGVPVIQAQHDAEAQCAANDISGQSYATITEDSDYLLFGGSIILRQESTNSVTEIKLENVLKELKITYSELIDFGILLGTDYCPQIKGASAEKIYKIFMECDRNVEKYLDHIKQLNFEAIKNNKIPKYKIPENFIECYKNAKIYYTKTKVINPNKLSFKWNEPDYNKLEQFLTDNEINTNRIDTIREIRSTYSS